MNTYEQLKRDEGENLSLYKDHLGFYTIGIGILVDPRKGGKLYPEESEFIFNNRLSKIQNSFKDNIPWALLLDDARKGVLFNMAYQLGIKGLLNFKETLRLVRAGDYTGASDAMWDSKWATQTPERASRLCIQMKSGVWQ